MSNRPASPDRRRFNMRRPGKCRTAREFILLVRVAIVSSPKNERWFFLFRILAARVRCLVVATRFLCAFRDRFGGTQVTRDELPKDDLSRQAIVAAIATRERERREQSDDDR